MRDHRAEKGLRCGEPGGPSIDCGKSARSAGGLSSLIGSGGSLLFHANVWGPVSVQTGKNDCYEKIHPSRSSQCLAGGVLQSMRIKGEREASPQGSVANNGSQGG